MKRICLLIIFFLVMNGCAHVVSQDMRKQVDKGLTPAALFKTPEQYTGKTVILGGTIISAKNTDQGTYVEVLQKPLDYRGRPENTDISYGRFIIYHQEYLDAAIYSTGKDITAGGTILGTMLSPLGDIQYPYLLILAREIHLFGLRTFLPIQFSMGILSTFKPEKCN
jgi:outer membrane lipoprotein